MQYNFESAAQIAVEQDYINYLIEEATVGTQD